MVRVPETSTKHRPQGVDSAGRLRAVVWVPKTEDSRKAPSRSRGPRDPNKDSLSELTFRRNLRHNPSVFGVCAELRSFQIHPPRERSKPLLHTCPAEQDVTLDIDTYELFADGGALRSLNVGPASYAPVKCQ